MKDSLPLVTYPSSWAPRECGQKHGELWRQSIRQLANIRKDLMLARNQKLKGHLDSLAQQQWACNQKHFPEASQELQGIAEGAGLPLRDIIILNNYTDFRDLPQEGCSTVYSVEDNVAGQTWDMHQSAKDYLCLLHIEGGPLVLSLTGCVGLMGINTHLGIVGVNNLNTNDARPGVIWPSLVRHLLAAPNFEAMEQALLKAPVTSGHNYMLAFPGLGAHWEITPTKQSRVAYGARGLHTNHALCPKIQKIQSPVLNSTTFIRQELLAKKIGQAQSLDGLVGLLRDHDNFPKSICSHFESGAQDPSTTCGGGALDFCRGESVFWRGCPEHDPLFCEHRFVLKEGGHFERVRG